VPQGIYNDLKGPEKLLKEAGTDEQEVISVALARVKKIKRKIDALHGNSLIKKL
jgi:hypothetical protein